MGGCSEAYPAAGFCLSVVCLSIPLCSLRSTLSPLVWPFPPGSTACQDTGGVCGGPCPGGREHPSDAVRELWDGVGTQLC